MMWSNYVPDSPGTYTVVSADGLRVEGTLDVVILRRERIYQLHLVSAHGARQVSYDRLIASGSIYGHYVLDTPDRLRGITEAFATGAILALPFAMLIVGRSL